MFLQLKQIVCLAALMGSVSADFRIYMGYNQAMDGTTSDEARSLPDRDPNCDEFIRARSATDSIYGDLTRGEGGYNCDGCEGKGDIKRLEITDSHDSPFTSGAVGVLTLYQRKNDKLWYDLVSFDKAGGSMTGSPGYCVRITQNIDGVDCSMGPMGSIHGLHEFNCYTYLQPAA